MFTKDYCELNRMYKIGDIGLVKVKPFEYLENSPWKDEEWEMRLLNAGELLEVMQTVRSMIDQQTEDERQLQLIEMFIRSVVRRNGRLLVSDADVEQYNKDHNLEGDRAITRMQLARLAAREIEQYVLNTWNNQYAILLSKQQNLIMGVVVCKNCGQMHPRETEGLPEIENIDEVPYCPSCKDEYLKEHPQDEEEDN